MIDENCNYCRKEKLNKFKKIIDNIIDYGGIMFIIFLMLFTGYAIYDMNQQNKKYSIEIKQMVDEVKCITKKSMK